MDADENKESESETRETKKLKQSPPLQEEDTDEEDSI